MIPFEHTGLHNIRMINSDNRAACNFQTLLVIQPYQEIDPEKDTLILNGVSDVIARGYPLMVEFNLTRDGFVSRATIDPNVIEAGQTRRVLFQIDYLVQQLCTEKPSTRLGDVKMKSRGCGRNPGMECGDSSSFRDLRPRSHGGTSSKDVRLTSYSMFQSIKVVI